MVIGYDPLTRCREVSRRLETYRVNKQLKFLTVGYINRQPVICTASQVNGRCEGLIFTLKPGQDAVRTLNNLLAWREGQAATPSLYESGEIPYIDVRSRLGEDKGRYPVVSPLRQLGRVDLAIVLDLSTVPLILLEVHLLQPCKYGAVESSELILIQT